MEFYFLIIVVILFALAFSDLVVGVSNDAVNFLNSAIGSKAAPFKIVIITAALGVLVGATFSSGMMEVARKGIFHPQQFFFSEIIIIFLAVMMTDIILLDFFNTFALPTSTTVSIVFELLGAAVAVSIIKIIGSGDAINNLGTYINSSSALLIISGILLSVLIAFLGGVAIQWIVRLVFSFNFEKTFKYFGALWGGVAISAITYFILIKGAKGSSFLTDDTVQWIMDHTGLILLLNLTVWTLLLQMLFWFFRMNILKFIVLVGTFALAMAFAGNDLVNFIGVPLAGFESFKSFSLSASTDPSAFEMIALSEKIKTPTYFLLIAGLIMVVTLFLSRKARSVTATEINLGRQDEGYERFNSSMLARNLVRSSITINNLISKAIPVSIKKFISGRFEKKSFKVRKREERVSFDLVRASVNLVVASALISFATSLKLPLSTTYVTFMVAMGSSLADGAWGRESAVYRISGVITVIGGWFFTALSAFTLSFIFAYLIHLGGMITISLLIVLIFFLFLKTYTLHRKRDSEKDKAEKAFLFEGEVNGKNIIKSCNKNVFETLSSVSTLYKHTINGLIEQKRKRIKKAIQEIKELNKHTKQLKNNLPLIISQLKEDDIETGHYYVQVLDYLRETVHCLTFISEPIFEYIDNNHPPLNSDQSKELVDFREEVTGFIDKAVNLLKDKGFDNIDQIIQSQQGLLDKITKINKKQLKRIKNQECGTKNSMLYLNTLVESKNLLLYTVNLIKAQRDFLLFNTKNMIAYSEAIQS